MDQRQETCDRPGGWTERSKNGIGFQRKDDDLKQRLYDLDSLADKAALAIHGELINADGLLAPMLDIRKEDPHSDNDFPAPLLRDSDGPEWFDVEHIEPRCSPGGVFRPVAP